MHKKVLYIVVLAVLALMGCEKKTTTRRPAVARELKWCYINFYGQFYEGCEQNVVSLDLYSEGLTLDSTGMMQGSGTNIYLSDVFIPSDAQLPPAGVYRTDTTAAAYTILPGADYEDNPTGIYRLLVQENEMKEAEVQQVVIYPDSLMRVSYVGDSLDIELELYPAKSKTVYKAHYRGIPVVENKSKHTKIIAR